jgi:putative membrane protein
MSKAVQKVRNYNLWIIILSIAIPIVVAFLFTVRLPGVERIGILPPIYAAINALTAIFLIIAVIQIKKRNKSAHELLMKCAIGLSALFLILYIVYHITSDSTKFGDANYDGVVSAAEKASIGSFVYVYYFILITHIVLSVVVIPFVLITYVRAITGRFEMHRKIARITFPLWLYVAVTGVVVYILISPYYPL